MRYAFILPMHAENAYPLLLEAHPVERPWGGQRIASRFNRSIPLEHFAESWEISARPEAPARVLNGPLAGMTLQAAWERLRAPEPMTPERFPLLTKLLDTNEILSVQVHPGAPCKQPDSAPNASSPAKAEPKNEMWHVLEADPGARIYAGLKEGTTPQRFRQAIRNGTVPDFLSSFPARTGQTVFMPGGCVHAIGKGCLIYEVQQNSDTTYRVYDWNRVDDQGGRRPLHIEAAWRTIDWHLRPPEPLDSNTPEPDRWPDPLVDRPWFRFFRIQVARGMTLNATPRDSLAGVFSLRGAVTLEMQGNPVRLEPGRSALIPLLHDIPCRLTASDPNNQATLLLTRA